MNKNDRRALVLFLSGIGIISAALLFQRGMKRLDVEIEESLKRQTAMYDAFLDYSQLKEKSLEIQNYIINYLEQNQDKEFEMLPNKDDFRDRC